jgi:hypothetical protein
MPLKYDFSFLERGRINTFLSRTNGEIKKLKLKIKLKLKAAME